MTLSPLTQRVEAIIGPSIDAMGYRLVRVQLKESSGGQTLQVMAEREDDAAMTVDDCADISRTVSALLDVEDPIPGTYTLEVSSPGLDRPLVKKEDFTRYAGFEIKLETIQPLEGRKRFKGKLVALEGETIVMQVDGVKVDVPFSLLHSAKLVLTDELIKAYLKKKD